MKVDTERIEALARQVADEEMVEVFDLQIGSAGPRAAIRVFLDSPGGVTLRDCETFSRKLGALLEVEDPIPGPYALEVSSPGLDRKLRRPEHFAASKGRRVRVALGEPVDGTRNVVGTLIESDGEGIEVDRGDRTFKVPYRLIRKASLDISQEELFGRGNKKR
jgi:ribosome maturation factor RimP